MSSSSSSVGSSGTALVVALPNSKALGVNVPAGRSPVCEVKRVVAASLQISPVLQRLTIEGSGVDAFAVPLQVGVSVRPARTESTQIVVWTLAETEIEGQTKFTVSIDPTDSVLDLKFLLADRLQVLPDFQRLYLRAPMTQGRVLLNDGKSLKEAGVFQDGARLRITFEFPSGIPGHGAIHSSRPKLLERKNESLRTMGDVFLNAVKMSPTKNFLATRSFLQPGKPERGPYVWTTYGQAGVRVGNIVSGLRSLGLKNKETIGIVSMNRTEWTLTDMACNVASFISVPLYDTLGPDAVEFIINHSSIRFVVASHRELKLLNSVRSKCPSLESIIVMDDLVNDAVALEKIPREWYSMRFSELEAIGAKNIGEYPLKSITKPEDVLTFCYTSGTTGNPKGAIITHGNIVSAVSAIDERASQEERGDEEVGFSYLPLAHIYERMLQASLVFNAGGIGFSQGDPLKLLEDVQALRPTLFPGVPRVWQRIYDRVHAQVADSGFIKSTLFNKAYTSKLAKLQSGDVGRDGKIASAWDKIIFAKIAALFGGRVKLMSTGAAPLSAKVADFMRVTFMSHFVEGYGMTETSAGLTCSTRDDVIYGQVGAPLDCNMVKLVDVPDMEYTSNDRPNPRGEIWVHGHNIFQGYYKQPEITAEVFHTDHEGRRWFMTGDIAAWLPDGSLKIIDRKKALFKLSQGEYCAPEKIENHYKQTKQLANVFVHGDSTESFLVAIVYPDPDLLKAYCAAHGIKGATIQEQVKDPRVTQWLQGLMDATAKAEKLRGFELVKRIHVSGEDFTVENGLLTPTLKLKRSVAAKHFGDVIAKMYKEGETAAAKLKAKL